MPCHRVLGADGKMGGFSANGGVATKRRILEIEGAAALSAPGRCSTGDDGRSASIPQRAVAHLREADPALAA